MRVAADSSSCLSGLSAKILMVALNMWIRSRQSVGKKSSEDVSHHWKAERDPHLEFVWYRHPCRVRSQTVTDNFGYAIANP